MNDDELITAVREQSPTVHMTTPVEQIISRGHAVRTRRRIPGLAGVLAVLAAAAFAVTALLPASHPASHQPGVQLAAWTVVKQADGTVSVTIRELRDPAGLQSTLRADGVPASVTFSGQQNLSCQRYTACGSPKTASSRSSTREAFPSWSSTPQLSPAAREWRSTLPPNPLSASRSAWYTPARSAPAAEPSPDDPATLTLSFHWGMRAGRCA